MSSPRINQKAVALFIVLGTIFIVIVLSGVILTIISSQSRFTYHQFSRIQAQYAAWAGINLALENLRTNVWTTGSYTLCSSGCTVNDGDIPFRVDIRIGAPVASGIRQISATATYTSP